MQPALGIMAWVLGLSILFAAVSASASGSSHHHSITFVNNTSSGSNAMILPLVFKQSHSENRRRHLSTANARMPLYDDLLLYGYYTAKLGIGTPPQQFALIVDTGSTVTFVPCSTCTHCGMHQDPPFQPELSRSYKPKECNTDCTCDDERKQCMYARQYAEMSSSSGVLGKDVISFGNQSDLKPQRAFFGCENMETGPLYRQRADGIMGLGRGELSFVDQLVKKGVITDSFSLCYGGMDVGGGAMVLGGISPPSDMMFTHSNPLRSQYYNVELSEIHVAGKKLSLNPKVFDRKHGTVLDSGTTYAYLPNSAFEAFKEAVFAETMSLKRVKGPDPGYDDICFSGAGSDAAQLWKAFPSVEMVFGKGQKLMLSPENYLFRHSKVQGAYCLGIFQNGEESNTILGAIIVVNTLVTYDRQHQRIGFWKTNCSHLWEKNQNLHSSSPISPASAPAPAPSSRVQMVNSSSTPNLAPILPPKLTSSVPPQPKTLALILLLFSLSAYYLFS